MLLGQGVACLFAVAVILIIYLFQDSYVIVETGNNKYTKPFSIPPENVLDIIKDQNGDPFGPGDILRDSNYLSTYYGHSHSLFPILISGELGQRDLPFPLDNYGNVINSGQPERNPENWGGDWPVQSPNSVIGRYTFDNYFSSRIFSPPKENRPLIIDFKKPRYPRGLRFKVDAIVKLGFYLTAKGGMDKIDVISEEPEGFGFALAVKEALRDSWIKPAVINDIKTGGYYTLTYEFCEKCPAKPVVVESSSNVIVTIK